MKAYAGKILRINLTNGEIKKEDLDPKVAAKFIGGRGLGTYILSKEIDPKIDALSEGNKLIFVTGPLTAAPVPTSGRFMVVTKSPLTGTVACSNSGGYWGAELKTAGYDLIILEGKSEKPVFLQIEDDKVELKDASHLWGKLVGETTDILESESAPKSKVLAIGPAGEKLSVIASVMNDRYRAAGRSGVGAVMGSKNFKAIVVKGSGKVEVANEEELKTVNKKWLQKLKDDGITGTGLPTYGTAVLVNVINESGVFPVNNFQDAYLEDTEQISGETLTNNYMLKKDPCYRCPIACGRYCKADEIEGGGPEYETVWAYSADCGVNDLKAVIKANFWCNEYGLDTISAGCTIAAAMELYQKGIIKDQELEGSPLEFGNPNSIVDWTIKMGKREGLGDKLAMGSYKLCESYGHPEISMSIKKQEIPAYDPRGIQGMGLQYATSNRGGCHVRGYLIAPELLAHPEAIDRFSLDGKATWVKIFQDFTATIDSLGLCLFTSFACGADDFAELINAVAGTNHDANSILEAGERIWNMEKVFNLAAGVAPGEDKLPKRLLEEGIPSGPSKGWVHKLGELLPSYYKERGWDEQGIPTKEKLEKLGL